MVYIKEESHYGDGGSGYHRCDGRAVPVRSIGDDVLGTVAHVRGTGAMGHVDVV